MAQDRRSAEASPVVLVVEHDALKRAATAADLRRQGFEVFEAAAVADARTILGSVAVDVLFSNVSLIDGRRRRLPTRPFWVAEAKAQPARRSRRS